MAGIQPRECFRDVSTDDADKNIDASLFTIFVGINDAFYPQSCDHPPGRRQMMP